MIQRLTEQRLSCDEIRHEEVRDLVRPIHIGLIPRRGSGGQPRQRCALRRHIARSAGRRNHSAIRRGHAIRARGESGNGCGRRKPCHQRWAFLDAAGTPKSRRAGPGGPLAARGFQVRKGEVHQRARIPKNDLQQVVVLRGKILRFPSRK